MFIPAGATWRYLDDGSDQGIAWHDAGFDDSAWPTDNVVAATVHNASSGNGDLGFDLRLAESADVAPPQPVEVIAAGADWRFLDNGSNQGTAWRDPGFDDTSWAVGAAELGYGDGDEATVIAEGAPRHVTAYFRSAFAIAQAADYSSLMLSVVRDDGVVVYLNGQEILRDNMPAGLVAYDTLASAYAWGANESSFHTFSIGAANLVNGVNTVAVEVHSADIGSADLSFDLALTLEP